MWYVRDPVTAFIKSNQKRENILIHGGVKVLYRFMVGLATFPLSKF